MCTAAMGTSRRSVRVCGGKQATSEQAWKRIATSSRTCVSRGGRVASACAIN